VSHNRRSYRYALACLGLLFTLAGCGGGGGGGSSTLPPGAAPTPSPAPTATPLPGSSTASIAVSAGSPASATFGPVTGGFSGTVTLPAASASSTLTATFLPGTSAPPGSPAIQNLRRRPANIGAQNIQAIAFITVTPSVTVSFPKTPDFTFTAPFAVAQLGAFAYVAEFDPTQSAKGWTTIEGPAAASGNTLTFTGTLPALTLQAGNTYEFLLFSVASALPTPSPSATPTATATATPSPAPTATPPVSQGTSCAATAAIARRPAARARSGDVVPNRLFVTYRSSAGSRGVQSAERSASVVRAVDLGTANGRSMRAVTLAPGIDARTATAALRADPSVADVQPVHYRGLRSDTVANDPLLNNVDQWYLYKTNVDPGAWALTHGSASISVALIDTGVDETNGDMFFDVKERVIRGVKTTGNGTVQDTNGHGTNTAGLATALTNNGCGFAGVGYSTHLQAYDIFPDATASSDGQSADTADEATAIRDAVANGASVISLSIGSPQSAGADAAEQSAVAFALSNGVAVVAAAGNEYPSTDGLQLDYPAAYPGVIAVGASGVTNTVANSYGSITAETVASYSNSGATLIAPGGDAASGNDNDILHWIEGYSTTTAGFPADRCSNSGGVCRVLFNGTSQATPQVAGAIALMEAYHGGARSLTPAQALALLQSSADPIAGVSATRQGAGRLNVAKAVAAAHP